jgi:hypothetical protein
MTQPKVTPGTPWLRARCGVCDWYREGIGGRGSERALQAAQKHVHHKGHPVEIQRCTPATVDLK